MRSLMSSARRIRLVILVSTLLVSALTAPAIAGYFPSRPVGVPVRYFTGVISNYSIGMGIGGFDLTIGQTKVAFNIGLPMKINSKVVNCRDPDCADWPPEIVEGTSLVTATCWSDMDFEPGSPTLFCDEINSAPAVSQTTTADFAPG
jgi:hypothetical protein